MTAAAPHATFGLFCDTDITISHVDIAQRITANKNTKISLISNKVKVNINTNVVQSLLISNKLAINLRVKQLTATKPNKVCI